MSVVWRPRAQRAFLAATVYLFERNRAASAEMVTAVALAVERLQRMPKIARPSRYPGTRAWSLTKWSKIIVFREIPAGIEIVAFLDARESPPEKV